MKQYSKTSINDLGGTLNEIVAPSELPTKDVIECVNWRVHKDGRSREKRPGYSKLKEIDGNPPIVQLHEYKDANNLKKTVIVTPHEVIIKKDVASYSRVYLEPDTDMYSDHKALYSYKGKMVTWDKIDNDKGDIIYTEDGENWSTLCTITGLSGAGYKGSVIAEFNNNLFITGYSSSSGGRVMEWDGSTVTHHLTDITNYHGCDMLPWDGRLWVITYVTPSSNDKWKVYYYNGGSWASIDNYGGNSEIDSSGSWNQYNIDHRLARLFVFGGHLYLLTTVYNATKEDFTWQVWKFDASTYDKFTKIYDSADDNELYGLSAIFEHKGVVYVVGSKLDTTDGVPKSNEQRLYSSTDMVSWTVRKSSLSLGMPMGETEFDGRIYLNCSWYDLGGQSHGYTKVWYLDIMSYNFILETTITTNPGYGDNMGGGILDYNGNLYAAKYMEVYKREVTSNEYTNVYYTEKTITEPPPKVVFEDRLLIGGEQDGVALEGESTYKLGIEAPETAPSVAIGESGNLTGDYQYVVTFYRSGNYPCESNPSPASDVVSPSGQKVNLTDIPISPDPKVNARRIYRTTAGGAIFYWLADIEDNSTTTFEDDYHDDELGDEVSYDRYPPPQGKYYEVWDNRLWIAGNNQYPNMLYFTNTGTAEEMASTNFLAIKRRESDVITQIKAFGDYLYVWKKKSWLRIEKIGDSLYEVVQRPEKIGCDASQSVAVCNKLLIWKSEYGIEVFNGDSIFRPILSKVIQRTIDSINKNYLYKCIGGHNPVDGEYWLSIPTGTDTDPTKVIVLDYLKGYFTIYEFAKGISSFYPTTDANGDLVTLVGTPDGFIYVMGDGYTDDGEVINAHFKTGWIPIADEPYIWSILRRIFVRYILPANKTITMKVYKNFEKTPILTKTLSGATPTDNVELRNEIMKRVDARVAGYYIQLEFINNEDVGGECRITGVDLFFRKKLPKHSVEAD